MANKHNKTTSNHPTHHYDLRDTSAHHYDLRDSTIAASSHQKQAPHTKSGHGATHASQQSHHPQHGATHGAHASQQSRHAHHAGQTGQAQAPKTEHPAIHLATGSEMNLEHPVHPEHENQ